MNSSNYFDWSDIAKLKISHEKEEILISGNAEALKFLGEYLLRLAQSPAGTHMHLDEFNSLDEGSKELIIEKID